MTKNKKIINSLIAVGLSLTLIGTTTLIVSNYIFNDYHPNRNNNPLNRGDNYEQFDLSSYLMNDNNLNDITDATFKNGQFIREISENKLVNYFKNQFRNVFNNIPKFKNNKDRFQFDLHYQIQNNKNNVLVDLVWYLPNANWFYFDQINIKLM